MIKTAIQAALDAGDAILQVYARDFEVEYKADASPLTEADKAAHDIIIAALASTPHPVLSEESREIPYAERKHWSTFWLVDPLDGTKEFIKKNDEFTVNIALINDGVPVMGVVYAPVLRKMYFGMARGAEGMAQGAWRSEVCKGKSADEVVAAAVPCAVRRAPCAPPLRVVASRSHCNEETTAFIAALEAEYGEVERVSRGSSLKLCMVAEGAADIYPRIAPTMEWDTAAAHAVVTAAGGQVVQFDPAVVATAYLSQGAERIPHGAERIEQEKTRSPGAERHALSPLRYNKENLLNPYFVVSGLHK